MLCLVVALVLCGCSSTRIVGVRQIGQRQSTGESAESSSAAQGGAGGPSATDTAGAGGAITGGAAAGASSSATGARPVSRPVSSATAPSAVVGHPPGWLPAGPGTNGVTDSTIKVGLTTVDTAQFNAAFAGVTGNPQAAASQGYDANAAYTAVISYINAHGGIAGRTVVPVFYQVNTSNYVTASGRQQETQRACSRWTEDEHVFAFVGLNDPLIIDCAVKTKTALVSGWLTEARVSDAQASAGAPYLYQPSTFTTDRQDRDMAQFFVANGFFDQKAKVALFTEDKAASRNGADRGMKPILAAAGIKTVDIYYPDAVESSWNSYVLQMQTQGITHVIFTAGSGGVLPPLFLTRAAESQGYRPKWGMASTETPSGLITVGNLPPQQAQNILGMGWIPAGDDGDATLQGPEGDECGKVLKAAGQPVSDSCNFLFFLRDALAHATALSPQGLSAAVEGLATSFRCYITLDAATKFGPNHHDGASMVRKVVYDPGANNMIYTGPTQTVP